VIVDGIITGRNPQQNAVILEQAFFAQRKPALNAVEGDLGEPREGSPSLRRNNRAFGSLPKAPHASRRQIV